MRTTGRLVVRTGHRGIDALGQTRIHRAGQLPQSAEVGVDEVDELGSHQG